MKLVLIAAVSLLASCKGSSREPPPASSAGPGSGAPASPAASAAGGASASPSPEASTLDTCRISLVALDQATCKTPEAVQSFADGKKAIRGILDTIGKAGGADPRQFHVMCAQMLVAIERDAARLGCTLALDAGQRKDLMALLDEWYAQRTPVAPTGDAASDAVIARIVAMRDAACACRDAACLERVDQQLVAIGALPASAPEAARTLGSKLLEDAGRCASRVRTLGDPPR